MTSMETTLFIILALYFSIKLLVELLARLDNIMAMLNAIFTYTAQPPVNNSDTDNNNVNGDQDGVAVVIEEIDDEVAPVEQDQASAASVSSSNSSSLV